MTQSRIVGALSIISIVLLVLFIRANTYWEDIPIATPPKGEAITNPFYAAQRFAEELGASTAVLDLLRNKLAAAQDELEAVQVSTRFGPKDQVLDLIAELQDRAHPRPVK